MAAEHASDNKAALESALGRPVTGTDLYMAHYLGLGGARSFLSTMASDPDRGAASIFPAAARANRGIFYAAAGHLRSEEHTSELQSLMRISYAVFCLKKKNTEKNRQQYDHGASTHIETASALLLYKHIYYH